MRYGSERPGPRGPRRAPRPDTAGAAAPFDRAKHEQQRAGAQRGDQHGPETELVDALVPSRPGERAADERAKDADATLVMQPSARRPVTMPAIQAASSPTMIQETRPTPETLGGGPAPCLSKRLACVGEAVPAHLFGVLVEAPFVGVGVFDEQ